MVDSGTTELILDVLVNEAKLFITKKEGVWSRDDGQNWQELNDKFIRELGWHLGDDKEDRMCTTGR